MASDAGLDPIQTCSIILKAEAGQAPSDDTRWFSGSLDDPALIFQEAATRWFWTWGRACGYNMDSVQQRQAVMYDWLGNGMESAQRRIYAQFDLSQETLDNRFILMCEQIVEPSQAEWRQGDGMWSWANDYLYDPYPEAQNYLRSHYRYRYGEGPTAWYIVDAETVRMLDILKGR